MKTSLAFLLALLPIPAAAENCASAQRVLSNAAAKWGETPAAQGIVAEDGTRLVMTLNEKTKTFTFIEISPDGTACLISAGTDWSRVGDPA